jgi:MbtH protein
VLRVQSRRVRPRCVGGGLIRPAPCVADSIRIITTTTRSGGIVIFGLGACMSSSTNQPEEMYEVVVNHEEQYSIWPVNRTVPDGWTKAGKQGSKESCLAYIAEVWTDMRPLSLRRQMQAD